MTIAAAALAGLLAAVAAWDALAAWDPARALTSVTRALAPARRAGRAGEAPGALERRRVALTASVVLGGAGWLVGGPLPALVLAALAPAAGAALIRARRQRWQAAMGAAAAPIARILADGLAAGRSLPGALALAASDGAIEPRARAALATAATQIELGRPADVALARLGDRAGPGPWRAIVAAILVQRRTGGDLSRLLRDLAEGVDETARAEAAARTASAQARLTARIVVALPVLGCVITELAAPGALSRMLSAPGPRLLVMAAVVLQVIATLAVRRIARVTA